MPDCKDCPCDKGSGIKPWWESRTLWFNGTITVIVAGVAVSQAVLPALLPILDPTTAIIATAIVSGLNALLRLDTNTAIEGGFVPPAGS